MNISSLTDLDKWQRHLAMLRKRASQPFRQECDSAPVFLMGKQRCGAKLLIEAFQRHPDILVFTEHSNNQAFIDYRLRDINQILHLTREARFPTVCFTVFCDSHKLRELYSTIPSGRYIWMYNNFTDSASATFQDLDAPTRAIKLACTNQPGGGWFQEGISESVSNALQSVYRPTLSEFDLACLTWWTRNQLIIESGLIGRPNINVLPFESLIADPESVTEWLCNFTGIDQQNCELRSIPPIRNDLDSKLDMDDGIRRLCLQTLATLDKAFREAFSAGILSASKANLT